MANPFVEKAKRKQQRDTMLNHVRELEGIHARLDDGEAKERIAKRLEEARRIAKQFA
jgi:hypothetical protein